MIYCDRQQELCDLTGCHSPIDRRLACMSNKKFPTRFLMIKDSDIRLLAEYCKTKLDLANVTPLEDYQSLPLSVIDAVFSINSKYTSTTNTVARFCKRFNLRIIRQAYPPQIADQLSISGFVKLYETHGIRGMAEQIYQNRQRTSTRNGILKSEAVLRFSQTLQHYRVNYFQDMNNVLGNPKFEAAIATIPGQSSGLSTRYFYMLSGAHDYVKPDRMIIRFIESALHQSFGIEDSHKAVVGACKLLATEFPILTPRLLDNTIWNYQRTQ